MTKYDVAIIGMGPAGITAGIYCSRYNLKTIVIGQIPAGTAAEAHLIYNYPGLNEIKGFEFSQKLLAHLKFTSAEIKFGKVDTISKDKDKDKFLISLGNEKITAKKIIVATGTKRKRLGLDTELKFHGKGVSYCATCDGMLYKEKIVGVVGGGDAALSAAILLAEYSKKVYIFYRKSEFFRAEPAWVDAVKSNKKIVPVFNSEIKEYHGKNNLESVMLNTGKEYKLDGIFLEIGALPNTEMLAELKLKKDEFGFINSDKYMQTSVMDVFVAGDVRSNVLKQIVVACGEGAIAATSAYHNLTGRKKTGV